MSASLIQAPVTLITWSAIEACLKYFDKNDKQTLPEDMTTCRVDYYHPRPTSQLIVQLFLIRL